MSTPGCDHKFVDSTHCLKCGWTPPSREAEIAARLDYYESLNSETASVALEDVRYLLAQLQQAREALQRYGQHIAPCQQRYLEGRTDRANFPCTCGLDDALHPDTGQKGCDHKFIDSTHCLKCGWIPPDTGRATENG